MEPEIRAALAAIPQLAGTDPDRLGCERLGGLTNRVYRIGDWCLRLPGRGTEDYIDREVEAVNARAAAAAGVSPELVHFGTDGVMVTRFLPGVVTMSPERFRSRPGAVERAALALRRLHTEAKGFTFRFELFGMIDQYLQVLGQKGAAVPERYHDVVREAGSVRAALAAHELPLTACHWKGRVWGVLTTALWAGLLRVGFATSRPM